MMSIRAKNVFTPISMNISPNNNANRRSNRSLGSYLIPRTSSVKQRAKIYNNTAKTIIALDAV